MRHALLGLATSVTPFSSLLTDTLCLNFNLPLMPLSPRLKT